MIDFCRQAQKAEQNSAAPLKSQFCLIHAKRADKSPPSSLPFPALEKCMESRSYLVRRNERNFSDTSNDRNHRDSDFSLLPARDVGRRKSLPIAVPNDFCPFGKISSPHLTQREERRFSVAFLQYSLLAPQSFSLAH